MLNYLTWEVNKLRTKGHWQFDSKLIYPGKDLQHRSHSCHFCMVWSHLMTRLTKRRTRGLPFDDLKWPRGERLLCSWLESWKEGRTAAPSLSSSIPGTVLTFFYSCLQTRRAETDGHCSCNVCSEENEHFIFEKGWCVFVPGVYNLIL